MKIVFGTFAGMITSALVGYKLLGCPATLCGWQIAFMAAFVFIGAFGALLIMHINEDFKSAIGKN